MQPAIFLTPDCKKNQQSITVRVVVICNDHRLLCQNSYEDVDHKQTQDESILHKITIIINNYYYSILSEVLDLKETFKCKIFYLKEIFGP